MSRAGRAIGWMLTAVLFTTHAVRAAEADVQLDIGSVTVLSARPMKSIGLHETRIDSAALRDHIARSLADLLDYNSPVFVKSYGRATLSTVSFRGTSPSHTQVTWNGMNINSPMLGMTDFSTIPAFFLDNAELLHGTSSVTETGGGLGGAVRLTTMTQPMEGNRFRYIQGIGQFSTFDEFMQWQHGRGAWQFSTRASLSTSPNRYRYINYDKKENIYDGEHRIVGQYYPEERNEHGSFRDLHLLQEVSFTADSRTRWSGQVWYFASNREIPLLTTSYGVHDQFENRQREETLRSHLSRERRSGNHVVRIEAGYMHTHLAYDYKRDAGSGEMAVMTRSRSTVHTVTGQAGAEFTPHRHWFLTTDLTARQHFVRSTDKHIIQQDGNRAVVGYDQGRFELSGAASVKWRPNPLYGLSAVLRQELWGEELAPPIPALFFERVLSSPWEVVLNASVSRNYRFPSLNDLYFQPGGNTGLKPEKGFTYDAGLSFSRRLSPRFQLSGNGSWFSSQISDWILWLPTAKGFFSPRNVQKVHAYGIESQLTARLDARPVRLDVTGHFAWTASVNRSSPGSPADQSSGKQLPYVPRRSASATARMAWHRWELTWQWCHYSRRYTMSSNEYSLSGQLPAYFMNDVSIARRLSFPRADIQFKCAVENIFDEAYISVLSHPMPGRHFEVFVAVTPRR